MPKVKTNSGAKKRFALTGTGKIKRKHAFHSHILTKKTKKQNATSARLVSWPTLTLSRYANCSACANQKLLLTVIYSIECPARKCHSMTAGNHNSTYYAKISKSRRISR